MEYIESKFIPKPSLVCCKNCITFKPHPRCNNCRIRESEFEVEDVNKIERHDGYRLNIYTQPGYYWAETPRVGGGMEVQIVQLKKTQTGEEMVYQIGKELGSDMRHWNFLKAIILNYSDISQLVKK